MSLYLVRLHTESILVQTSLDLVREHEVLEGRDATFIVEVERVEREFGKTIGIMHEDANERTLQPLGDGFRLAWPTNDLAPGALLYLAHALLERKIAQKGYFSLHSACVELGSVGILLLGASGAGKTSTAISLCRQHGGRLIGNDLTVVGLDSGRPHCVAGTKSILLREASVQETLPDLAYVFGSSVDPWRTKVFVSPASLGIEVVGCSTEIGLVVFLHIDQSRTDVHIGETNNLASRLFLHEQLARYIRGTALFVSARTSLRPVGFMPSFDTPDSLSRRTLLVEDLVSRSTYLTGPIDQICNTILDRVKGKQIFSATQA